jgi:prostaglandin-E synthase 1
MTPSLFALPAFQTWALCSAIIVVTLYGLGFRTAAVRAKRQAVVNAEDVGVNPGSKVVDSEHPDVLRVKRAHLNAMENAIPFFVMGFVYSLTDPNMTMARIVYFGFVAARILHAFFYLNGKQPFRTGSFVLGAVANLVMTVQVVRAALAAW